MTLTGLDYLLGIEILAYMSFPNDERARHALIASVVAKSVASTQATNDVAFIPPDVLSLIVEAQSLPEQLDAAVSAAKQHGYIVGHTLLTLIELQSAGEKPSFGKAHHIVSGFLTTARNIEKEKIASSIASLRTAWLEFNGVAHLWASHCLLLDKIGNYKLMEHYLASDEGLRIFLATAHSLHQMATSIVIDGHGPILDPERTWGIPASLNLPTASWTVSGLDEEQRERLAAYKRRSR